MIYIIIIIVRISIVFICSSYAEKNNIPFPQYLEEVEDYGNSSYWD